MKKNYQQIANLEKAYLKVVGRNPDIASEACVDTLERISLGVTTDFNSKAYFKSVFNKKSHATPKEKGRNNKKEVNVALMSDSDLEDAITTGTVPEVVWIDEEEGYDIVDTKVSMLETIAKLKDEVELNELDFNELITALNERFTNEIESEITLSMFLRIGEIKELLKEVLSFNNSLQAINSYV